MRILSFNVLAPHLFLHFWNSYAGDNPSPQTDDEVLASLIEDKGLAISAAFEEIIEKHNPDVILLQEITLKENIGLPYSFPKMRNAILKHEQRIEDSLDYFNFKLIGDAYKPRPMKWRFPSEPDQGTKNPLSGTSGVSTFVKNSLESRCIYQSTESKTPMVIIEVMDPLLQIPVLIANIHVAMNYPHVNESLDTIWAIISQLGDTSHHAIIIAGDFNTDTDEARSDFNKWRFVHNMKSLIVPIMDDRGTDRAVLVLPSRLNDAYAKILLEYDDILIFHHADPVTSAQNIQRIGITSGRRTPIYPHGPLSLIQSRMCARISGKRQADFLADIANNVSYEPMIVTDHRPLLITIL